MPPRVNPVCATLSRLTSGAEGRRGGVVAGTGPVGGASLHDSHALRVDRAAVAVFLFKKKPRARPRWLARTYIRRAAA